SVARHQKRYNVVGQANQVTKKYKVHPFYRCDSIGVPIMTTPQEADLINKDRAEQAQYMQKRLTRMGVSVRVTHFTGDSSFPTEWTLRYGTIYAVGPTFDLALLDFVERLLKGQEPTQRQS